MSMHLPFALMQSLNYKNIWSKETQKRTAAGACFPTANLELLVKQYSKIFCCARRENTSLSMKTPRNQSKKSRVSVLIIVRQVARKTYPAAVRFVCLSISPHFAPHPFGMPQYSDTPHPSISVLSHGLPIQYVV